MDTEKEIPTRIVKLAESLRTTGWWFLVGGIVLCIDPIAALLNPSATISVNGIPANDFSTKLAISVSVLVFPVSGAFIVFAPKKTFTRWLFAFDRWGKLVVWGRDHRE